MKRKIVPALSALAPKIPKYLLMSYYIGGITNTRPEPNPVSLSQVFEWVRSSKMLKEMTDRYRQSGEKSLKEALPYITQAGIFEERQEKGFLLGSHVYVIDIDKVPEGEAMHPETGEFVDLVEILKYNIMHDKNLLCLATMRSPSGNGVKAYIWHPMPGDLSPFESYPEEHKSLNAYMKTRYVDKVGGKVDEKCSDLARATFLCYDPNILTIEDKLRAEKAAKAEKAENENNEQ